MTLHNTLEHFEDNWQTSMGGWYPCDKVILRGKNVFTELNNHSWMQYLLFAVTGRESEKIARLVEGIWVISTSFPDPRIWNNRVSALAGTARSTGALAAAASVAVTEATLYGLRPIKGAADFFCRADQRLGSGESLESIVDSELKQFRSVYGYGRPMAKSDERVQPMMELAHSIGCGNGKFIKLAFEVGDYLSSTRLKYQINIAAVCAALLIDEELKPIDFYNLMILGFSAGAMACFIDANNQQEGTFFPLRTSRLAFSGSIEEKKWTLVTGG